jgi:hypothetical protein
LLASAPAATIGATRDPEVLTLTVGIDYYKCTFAALYCATSRYCGGL